MRLLSWKSLGGIGLLACWAWLATAAELAPPERAAGVPVTVGSLVDYPRLEMSGTRWWGDTRLSRNLFIRLPPSAKQEPRVILQELESKDDNSFFPVAGISVGEAVGGGPAEYTIQLVFNLDQAPSSGAYEGKIRINYGASEYLVPVTVTVKDPWALALLVILFGVVLGIWANAYQAEGRPRDELLLRISRLRRQMRSEQEHALFAPFAQRVEELLVETEIELQGGDLDNSQLKLKDAQQVWNRWRKGRNDWLAQLGYHAELSQRLQDVVETAYSLALREGLVELSRQAAHCETPAKLRELLQNLGEQVTAYLPLDAKLRELPREHAVYHLIRDRLNGLRPFLPDPAGPGVDPSQTRQSVESLGELLREVGASGQISKGGRSLPSGDDAAPESLVAEGGLPSNPPKVLHDLAFSDLQQTAELAKVRLQWFGIFSYATAVVFLAGAGFDQLYSNNDTFGANPVNDYLGLLAWGFAAESSRASVTKLVKEWRPGSHKTG